MRQTSLLRSMRIAGVAALLAMLASCSAAGAGGSGVGGGTPTTPAPEEPGETNVTVIEDTASAAATAAQAAATDPTAASYAGIMGGVFGSVGGYFEVWDTTDPNWQEDAGDWIYEYTLPDSDGVYWRWVISQSETAWTYQLYFDFDSDNELELYLDGTVAFDGSSGSFDYYFGGTAEPAASATWSTATSGQITYIYDVPDAWKITMVTSSDGSTGTMTVESGTGTDTYMW